MSCIQLQLAETKYTCMAEQELGSCQPLSGHKTQKLPAAWERGAHVGFEQVHKGSLVAGLHAREEGQVVHGLRLPVGP